MRHSLLALILVPLFCLSSLPAAALAGTATARADSQPALGVDRLEIKIHDRINQERKRAGLPSLAWNQALQRIARDHSRDMAAHHFFSHTGPDGRDFSERYQNAGFDCSLRTSEGATCLGGENIALTALYSSITWRNGRNRTTWNTEEQIAASVVRQWMASPGHRRNILTRSYQRQGIGVAIGRDGRVLITENFC